MSPDEPTLGEIGRRVTTLEAEMRTRFDGLSAQVNNLGFVRRDLYDSEQRAQNERIDFLARTVWATLVLLVTSILGAIVTVIVKVVSS